MLNLSKNSTPNYCIICDDLVTKYTAEKQTVKQTVKKPIMRKEFKQLFRGLAELTAVFTAVFMGPALLAAFVNFDISVYFSCIHNATYCVLLTMLGIIVSIFYTSMHQ
jgi:hypothetical protein